MTTNLVRILQEAGIADKHVKIHPLLASLGEIFLTIADRKIDPETKVEKISGVLNMLTTVMQNNTELVSTLQLKDIDKILKVIKELDL